MLVKKSVFLLFALFSFSFLMANTQDVELLADSAIRDGKIIKASGNVIMYSKEYLITADNATYDEDREVAEFFGNVNVIRGENETSRTHYFKLNLKDDENFATENFVMDRESELWTQSDESCSDRKYYRTKGSITSSCNVQNPDWSIKYSSGKLNRETEFLHIFNPVFYLGNTPVFYLPYFGLPTDDRRRTGLLFPDFGFVSKQGFYYKQPIYIAEMHSWDLQLDPQIRTRRGSGLYATFRFADSPYSYGEIRGGIFENKTKHQERLEYKNKRHKGFEFEYDRSKLIGYLTDGNFKEHLWIDFTELNDIEYYDLKTKSGADEDGSSLVTSRLNYYITNDAHYAGLYARYYVDTHKLNSENVFKDDDSIQELPTLHYHKFSDSIFHDSLLYSVDIKAHNYTRKEGVKARNYEFSMPLIFSTPLFNDWINFKFTEGFYASHVDYSRNYIYTDSGLVQDKSSDYINNYHKFSLGTDIAKAYSSNFHTMSFEVSYLIPGYQSGEINSRLFKEYQYDYDRKRGRVNRNALKNVASNLYYEDNYLGELGKDFTQENVALNFTQYLYDENGRKFIRHSAKQSYDFDDDELGNLIHRLDFYFSNGLSIGNKLEYNHEFDNIEKFQTYARYSNSRFSS